MTRTPAKPRDQRHGLRLYARLLRYVRPHWRRFALGIVAMVLLALTEPLIPALLKPILDGSFVDRDLDSVGLMALLLVAVFAVRGAASFASAYLVNDVGNAVVFDLRLAVFRAFNAVHLGYIETHPTGVLVSKITFDSTLVMTAATRAVTILVRDTLSLVGLLGWMFYLNWRLTFVALLSAPIIAVLAAYLGRRMRRIGREVQAEMGALTHVTEENLRGNKVIRVFGAQGHELGRFSRAARRVRAMQLKHVSANSIGGPVSQVLIACGLAVILYLSAHESAAGNFSIGSFVSFFGAMALLFSPIKRLMMVNGEVQRGLAAAESLFAVLDEPPEPDTGTRVIDRARGEVHFEEVSFAYAGTAHRALHEVSIRVAPGENVALVGPSGSGKTTLANMLGRFNVPQQGRVLLDGIDVRELTLQSLRAQVALVSQDIVLFDDSVSANIAYGAASDAVDMQRVAAAAEAAGAADFVNQLGHGLDTRIGEGGIRLSGGQRQRLAIARAFYKDAPVLIFDEATSSLDSVTERRIQAALEALKRGRTSLVIAHRLSTVERADCIYVIDQGRVVDSGDHATLLERCALYAQLYAMQHAAPAA